MDHLVELDPYRAIIFGKSYLLNWYFHKANLILFVKIQFV